MLSNGVRMNRHRVVGEREGLVMVAVEPRDRLAAFAADVLGRFDRASQRVNGVSCTCVV